MREQSNINWAKVEQIFGTEEEWLAKQAKKNPIIIGFGFKASAGKDTAANYLVSEHGFTRLSFADPLREAIRGLFGFSMHQMTDRRLKEKPDSFWKISPRMVSQKLGDALLGAYGEDFLIKVMEVKIAEVCKALGSEQARIAIADVRTLKEVEAIWSWGGRNYRIDRKDLTEVNPHRTETALENFDKWDGVLDNNGTPQDLFEQLEKLISS